MIIVEGPDGAGKTVLCGQISKEFPQLKMERIDHKSEEEEKARRIRTVRQRVYHGLGHAVAGVKPMELHDRFFYSEIVYGNLLRTESKFTTEECDFINRVLEALNPPVIFCLPPLEVVRDNLGAQKQMAGVKENIGAIYNTYQGILSLAGGILAYDYTIHDPKIALFPVIEGYIERRTRREW
jgi:hypothetical protein